MEFVAGQENDKSVLTWTKYLQIMSQNNESQNCEDNQLKIHKK